jgi:hypothetical protein
VIAFDWRGGTAADVPGLLRRICADDEEVGRGLEPTMPCSGGEHNDVASSKGKLVATRTSKNDARAAGCYSENLVGGRVVVVKVVDAVAPLGRPAVSKEGSLELRSGIGCGQIESAVIEQDRKAIVVGDPCIAGELESFGVMETRLCQERTGGGDSGGRKQGCELATIDWRSSVFRNHGRLLVGLRPNFDAGEMPARRESMVEKTSRCSVWLSSYDPVMQRKRRS